MAKKPKPVARKTTSLPAWWIYLLLTVTTVAVYAQVYHFDFVNFDDPEYVGGNNHVRAGLTAAGLVWALTSTAAANWFPLTWVSHMAAYQAFGMNAGWHHLVNVLFHLLATLFLFAGLHRMTRALWRSAAVAFLFALHPLHVESVAWIAERKDVLCAFFWFLAIWCYARYVERPSAVRYLAVVLAFVGGLMSKSMIVTLPFVFLLLDVWPLGRSRNWSLVWEKLPLFGLAAAVSLLTFVSQEGGHAVRSLASLPLGERAANAVWTYFLYIVRLVWPANLAVYYPYNHALAIGAVAAAGLLLGGVTVLAVRTIGERPYFATGWFWYAGTLAPVIGLVQVGGQSSADRYMYLPSVGLTIIAIWGADELVARFPAWRTAMVSGVVAVCAICLVLTYVQLGYWTNSGTLFQHAVRATKGNYVAENNLADYYLTERRPADAQAPVLEALRLNPRYPEAHINLATILRLNGHAAESEQEYRTALNLQPENIDGHAGYGALLVREGRAREALDEFQRVVALRPEYADGHYDLGRVLAAVGMADRAVAEFTEAVRLRPDYAEARHALGMALAGRGRLNEAIAQFQAETRLKPDDAPDHANLAMLLAGAGRTAEAIAQYREALRIDPANRAALQGLAAIQGRK